MSVETKHTPGPWHIRPMSGDLSGATLGTIMVGAQDRIASIAVRDIAEGKANARLIAAAPDMLEAMRAIRRETHEIAVMNSPMHGLATPLIGIAQLCFNLANAAIAKATGDAS